MKNPTRYWAFPLLLSALAGCRGGPGAVVAQEVTCIADSRAPRLHHVVVAVPELDAASAPLEGAGFRLKPGRVHPNGLHNRLIEFGNGTEVEWMTLAGEATDPIARSYDAILREGGGGAYVALSLDDPRVAEAAADAVGLRTEVSTSGPWRFVSFLPGSPAGGVFFGPSTMGGTALPVAEHANGALGVASATVEGGTPLLTLLARLGGRLCGSAQGESGRWGTRVVLNGGDLVVVPRLEARRARVLGITLVPGADPAEGRWSFAGGFEIVLPAR